MELPGEADGSGGSGDSAADRVQRGSVEKAEVQDIKDVALRDNESLYENDDDTSVVTMYLTVSRGNQAENTDHTWEEINTYSAYDYYEMGVARYQVAGLLQVGDENGPSANQVGYGETVPNATVQIRGQTSSRERQKNYKIELKKNKGTWNGQRTINLNKHKTDSMRFRNKLAYDLMEEIPQMMALRTQFVHLYVKDETGENPGVFEDYGLYTQVEQLNKTAMRTHGLDAEGQLYKVNYFEFYRYEDIIKEENDPDYDVNAFENLLEIKGNSDHSKLITMLEAVNDVSTPIDTVLDKYFNRENLTYWMAFQILVGNTDTQSRNCYLYSPLNSEIWYFISWDNDASFKRNEYLLKNYSEQGSWESGISNYWGNVLFQRCLKSESFRDELFKAVSDLKENYLSQKQVSEKISEYVSVTKLYGFRMPDSMYIGVTEAEYDQIAAAIPGEVEQNYQLYLESLKKPMPFFMGVPQAENGHLRLNWDPAYDFNAENITYTVEVATDYEFRNLVFSQENLVVAETQTDMPAPGQYFLRVRATNASGETQESFDYYVINSGKVYGTKCFYVNRDGTVSEDMYEE